MSDLVSHEDILSTINRLMDSGKLPHMLLYGPAGTGKTSTVLAFAHKMYGKHFNSMVLELNASDDRGIDVVRDQIKEFAGTRQMFSQLPKMIILDEADNMTNVAQVHTPAPSPHPPAPAPPRPARTPHIPPIPPAAQPGPIAVGAAL